MVGILLAMFLSALEQTIVAPALPTIGRMLHDVENLSWVVTAYLLACTAMTPLFGKLSDTYGRRAVMLAAVIIFLLGSVACALAPNMPALIAARALQGVGGGAALGLFIAHLDQLAVQPLRWRHIVEAGVSDNLSPAFLRFCFHPHRPPAKSWLQTDFCQEKVAELNP